LRQRAARHPDRAAFIFLDRDGRPAAERSYAGLDAAARRIAHELLQRNPAGAPVLLVFPPGLEFIDALFGCFYAGCPAVPAPYLMAKRAAERIAAICRDCRPALLLGVSRLRNDADVRG